MNTPTLSSSTGIMSSIQPIDYLTLIGHVEKLGVPVFDFVNHLTKVK